jgi:hypothetical protein|nr:hypothetical protein [uncultured Acetatifactor sp.]
MHQPPQGESIWGTINTCVEIALNVYMIVAVDGQGIEREGVMVRKNAVKGTLSEKAAAMGREDGDWLCFDEDRKDIPVYEVLQRRMALCRRMEAVVMKQMEEIRRDGKLSLTDYFGECAPPVETPAGRVDDMLHVRNGIYMTQDGESMKFAVHEAVADSFMSPMAAECGSRQGDYLFYDTASSAVMLNELKNVFDEVSALVISEDSLYATLDQNFSAYKQLYNACVPKEEQIPEGDAPAELFLAVQLEAARDREEQEGRPLEERPEEMEEEFGEQIDYDIR